MKKYLIPVAALIALCLAVPVAVASNHPTIDQCKATVSGDTINVNGSVKNLDKHKAVLILLIIKGTITGDCINPGGNRPPPHQNKQVDFEESRQEQFGTGNKKIDFKFKVKPSVKAGDVCPNANWTFEIKKIKLRSVLVKVLQGNQVAAKDCV